MGFTRRSGMKSVLNDAASLAGRETLNEQFLRMPCLRLRKHASRMREAWPQSTSYFKLEETLVCTVTDI